MLTIVLLAAGRASRMRGADKLLQPVDGAPLIATMAQRALSTGAPVIVCLPPHADPRARPRTDALGALPVSQVQVPDADLGMAHSLRAGIGALPAGCTGAMILPADMPDLSVHDLRLMAAAHKASRDAILRGTSATGVPGHPVIFPHAAFSMLRTLSGDVGAKAVIRDFDGETRLIALPQNHALTDLDTPEDWARWRDKLRNADGLRP